MVRLVSILAIVASCSAVSRHKVLGVRGGSLDVGARETAELCGIDAPENQVVAAIKGATSKVAKALGVSRGGSLDIQARELADLCAIAEPEKVVIDAIVGSARGATSTLKAALGVRGGHRRYDALNLTETLHLRGGSFDFRAREQGELVGLRDPERAVVSTIKSAFGRVLDAPRLLYRKVRA